MGGFAGGIVAGAMGGLGGAMEKQGEIAQQQQGQYANASNLAELNANLDVQKQASLLKIQQDNKIGLLKLMNDPRFSSPGASQNQQPIPVPVDAPPITAQPQMGLDTSQISPAVLDFLKKQNPDAVTQGIANMKKINDNQVAIASNQGTQTNTIDGVPVTTTVSDPSVNYPVPPTANSATPAYSYNSATGTMEPSINLQRGQIKASILGGDAGVADYMKNNQLSDAERIVNEIQRAGPNTQAGQALQRQLEQVGYRAPVSIRSNYLDSTGALHILPASAPAGFVNQQNPDGSWAVVPMKGGSDAVATEQSSKDAGTAMQKTWETQKAAAAQVPGTVARIETMERLLPQFTSGNGAQDITNWRSFAATHGIPVDKNATDAAQEFKKYSSQLLSEQRAGMGGGATDAAQDMAEAGSANIGLGNDVNKNVLSFMRANAIGTLNFQTAKQSFINQNGGTITPNQASNFDSQYNQNYDPQIILYGHMQPAQRDAFIDSLSPAQKTNFFSKMAGYTDLINRYK